MAVLDVDVAAALKEHYKPQRIKQMVYKNQPLLALMPKYTKFGGENMPIPVINGNPQKRSATFAKAAVAEPGSRTSKVNQFLLTRKKDYSLAQISHEAIRASKSDADAFIRYATMEIDGAIHSLKRSLGTAMYRDGSGSLGTTTTTGDGLSIQLADPADIVNFELGMAIVAATGTESLHNTNVNLIETIDRNAGSFTVDGSLGTLASGDHLYVLGDRDLKVSGLEAWCPEAAPTTELPEGGSFFGCFRGLDVTRLGGLRMDGSLQPIEEALVDGMSLIAREGGTPSHIFCNYTTYANLEKALGSKVQYITAESSVADVGFTGIQVHGPAGTVKVIPDVNCPSDVAWVLQLDTWSLNSLGECPQILDLDGNQMLRLSDKDAYEVRTGYYAQIGCSAPGWNCRIAL